MNTGLAAIALLCAAHADVGCLSGSTEPLAAISLANGVTLCAPADLAAGEGCLVPMLVAGVGAGDDAGGLPLQALPAGGSALQLLSRQEGITGAWEVADSGGAPVPTVAAPDDIWQRLATVGALAPEARFNAVDFTAVGMLDMLASRGSAALAASGIGVRNILIGWVVVMGTALGLAVMYARRRRHRTSVYKRNRPGSHSRPRRRSAPLVPSDSPLKSAGTLQQTDAAAPTDPATLTAAMKVALAAQQLAEAMQQQVAEGAGERDQGSARAYHGSGRRGRSRRKLHKRFSYSTN